MLPDYSLSFCIFASCFNSVFDWYFSMLGSSFYLNIVKLMPCNPAYKRLYYTSNLHFYTIFILYINSIVKMSHEARKPVFEFLTRSDTNRAVLPQKMARGLKFWIQIEEGLHYPCSKNKGAADLHLYFRICKKLVFSQRGSNDVFPFHHMP